MMWEVIQRYCTYFPKEAQKLRSATQFLQTCLDPFPRNVLPGHITGSGIVIQEQEILLIRHRYIREWFQPGGHVDPGETPLAGAIREVREETGWETIPSTLFTMDFPFDIDVHVIPANPIKNEPEHLHIDFAYLLEPIRQGIASDPEAVAWVDIKTCGAERLARCIQKYQSLKMS
jgi:8-oxo-dGTP pyrophosphatase MutT (NUDIX family)